MIVYFDHNISWRLAEAFQIIQDGEAFNNKLPRIVIRHINAHFGSGVDDVVWMEAIKNEQAFVITQDLMISRKKDELAALERYGIGMFFLRGKNSKDTITVFQMLELLAHNWYDMVAVMQTKNRPFKYKVTLKNGLEQFN